MQLAATRYSAAFPMRAESRFSAICPNRISSVAPTASKGNPTASDQFDGYVPVVDERDPLHRLRKALSDPGRWRQLQEQARLLRDPARWRRAQEQAQLLSDPARWRQIQEQARLLGDRARWQQLQVQARLVSDPARWQRAREDLRLLTDPSALASAYDRLAAARIGVARLQEEVRPLRDPVLLDELDAAARDSALPPAASLDREINNWDEELLEVTALDPALLGARDGDGGDFSWVGALPTLVQMRLLVQSLSMLNMIMLAAATLGVAAVPLPLILAAEVLIRFSDILWTHIREKD